ncbi:hypothetical protein PORY_001697 [Pneumocystis oryctolagi]|uniref:Uncharacterized protein n=1 Tax=Pneumocystis oryctolagi TaxID=42067 RepID=A0ACB7CEV7_9ASCO|nr:hypothetical protein PORY_001697 [Pneumocystis oryctolagi]
MGLGMGVGLLMGRSLAIRSRVTFQHVYFFNMLLPPIILNSGYELDQKRFFKNAGVIFTFAFAGTFISALVIGLFTYLWTLTGVENIQLSWIDAFIFGATLSATDPVTILSIFQTYGVDPTLYTIIFGESLLNDSVSIIMFGTLQQFYHKKMQVFDIFFGFVNFFVSFIISLVIGTVISILTALMLKHSHIRRFPHIESCIIILMAYASYLFSNGCHMSGIVSLLFCAITLKHYAFHNMSIQTQISTKFLFKTLSQLSENFIFIYLGISLFTQENLVYKPLLILVTIFSVCISRYIVVFPISKLINIISGSSNSFFSDKLPKSYQIMLFWSGLRGAVGVALTEGFKGDSTETLKATVLVVVVLTVIIFGGTAPQILEIVGIRIGIFQNEDYHIEYFYDKPIKLQEGMQDEFKNINKDSFLSNNHKMNPDNYDSHLNFNQPDSPDPIHHSYYSYESPKQTKSEDSDHASVNTDIFFPSNSFKSTYLDEDVYFTPAQYKTENRETFIESSQTSPGNHIKWFLNFDSKVLKPLVLEKDIFTKENDKKNPL